VHTSCAYGGVIVHLFSPVEARGYCDFSVNTITAAQSWYPMTTGDFSMGEKTIVWKANWHAIFTLLKSN